MKIVVILCTVILAVGMVKTPLSRLVESPPSDASEMSKISTNPWQDSVSVFNQFEATMEMLPVEKGGRKTPFYNNFRPVFRVGEVQVMGTITLPSSLRMVRPGDRVNISVKLLSSIELKKDQTFEIIEVGKKIGSGKVIRLLKPN